MQCSWKFIVKIVGHLPEEANSLSSLLIHITNSKNVLGCLEIQFLFSLVVKEVVAFKFSEVLHECILDVLENVIGETGMRVISLHVELGDYLEDPTELHRNLRSMFGVGAENLEKVVVKELFRRLDLCYEQRENFDFAKSVEQAKELFIARMKSWNQNEWLYQKGRNGS